MNAEYEKYTSPTFYPASCQITDDPLPKPIRSVIQTKLNLDRGLGNLRTTRYLLSALFKEEKCFSGLCHMLSWNCSRKMAFTWSWKRSAIHAENGVERGFVKNTGETPFNNWPNSQFFHFSVSVPGTADQLFSCLLMAFFFRCCHSESSGRCWTH